MFSPSRSAIIVSALAGYDCAVIYLFGSLAKNIGHLGSDIDIAFLPRSPIPPLDRLYPASTLSNQLGKSVDLVDLTTASTVFAKEVVANGTPLFIGDPLRHQTFEIYTFSDYARLNEERKEVLAGC